MEAHVSNEQLLRLPDVSRITTLSKFKIYQMIKEGVFPKSTRISHRVAVWKASEIDECIQNVH